MNGEFSGRIGVIQLGFDPRAEAGPVRPVVAPVRASKPKRGKKAKKAKQANLLAHVYPEDKGRKKRVQAWPTPPVLCGEMVSKLRLYARDLTGKTVLTLNLEFIPKLLELGAKVTFFADSEEKAAAERQMHPWVTVIIGYDFLEWEVPMQFDVTIGNPPYQPPVERNSKRYSGSHNVIWDQFVLKAMNLVKPNGFVSMVHPAKWRKPLDKVGAVMRKKKFLYLEIHGWKDGTQTFHTLTRYDWYVMQNCLADGLTDVRDELGRSTTVDMRCGAFIPNFSPAVAVDRLLAKPGDDAAKILYSRSAHGTDKRNRHFMHETEDEYFKYPCLNGGDEGSPVFWYSNRRGGFFGQPKVMFSMSGSSHPVILDATGDYSTTQNAMAIPISSPQEGELIKRAVESEGFNEFLRACRWSTVRTEHLTFQFLKKDFWREFL